MNQRMIVMTLTMAMILTSICLMGCDALSRSQGKFAIVNALGDRALGDSAGAVSFPSDDPWKAKDDVHLVKIGYRNPISGKLVDLSKDSKASRESYYMVIDVTNAIREPRLGASTDDHEYRRRLYLLADLLFTAADWNGEVYWRHLTTFLETYEASKSASRAALGAAIAGTFISPVLGAALAGGALAVDTFVVDYTSRIDVDSYAALRKATSLERARLRHLAARIKDGSDDRVQSLADVLVLGYDYAYTYSIKGALHIVQKTQDDFEHLLITGESTWQGDFTDAIMQQKRSQDQRGLLSPAESEKVKAYFKAQDERIASDAAAQKRIDDDVRATQEATARKNRALEESAAIDAEKGLKAKLQLQDNTNDVPASSSDDSSSRK